MRKFLNFNFKNTIELLFFVNLWVNIYTFSLTTLNFLFPAKIPLPYPNGIFLSDDVAPEPFEIPLYLITTTFIILLIYLYYKRNVFRNFYARFINSRRKEISIFIFLLVIFIIRLGFPPTDNFNIKSILVVASYLVFLIFSGVILFMSQIFTNGRFKKILGYFLVLVFVSVVTFEPRFPIAGDNYSYFIGPILEIAHGKTIYTQVPSQYGFFWILILASLAKLGIDVQFLPVFMWILLIVEYSICFYLIFKISKSFLFSLLGLFSIITVSYFSLDALPLTTLQSSSIRWPQLILSALLFYKFKDSRSFSFVLILIMLSLLTIDSGIELLAAYALTLFILLLKKSINLKQFLETALKIPLILISFFLIISFFNFLINKSFISIPPMFAKIIEFSRSGFTMIPVPHFNFFWFAIFFYIASLIYFFKEKNNSKVAELILFVTNLSLFASFYYLGRSHDYNLHHIALFPILNIFLLLGVYMIRYPRSKIALFVFFSIFFIVLPAFGKDESISDLLSQNFESFKQGNIFEPEMRSILTKKYLKEMTLIQNNFSKKDIVLLSPDDTYLLYLTHKYSLVDANPQTGLDTILEVNTAASKLGRNCPKKIVIDCNIFDENCSKNIPFVLQNLSQPVLFKQIETYCKVSYQKGECAGQLCIAQSDK